MSPKLNGEPTAAETRTAAREAALRERIAEARRVLGDAYVSPLRPSAGRTVAIVVPGTPPTPNARASYWQKNRDREEWREIGAKAARAAIAAWECGVPEWRPITKADVSVTFVWPDRRAHDYVNAIASLKPVEDGIVDAGVLADDSSAVILSFEAHFEYRKGERAVIYTVKEVC